MIEGEKLGCGVVGAEEGISEGWTEGANVVGVSEGKMDRVGDADGRIDGSDEGSPMQEKSTQLSPRRWIVQSASKQHWATFKSHASQETHAFSSVSTRVHSWVKSSSTLC